FDAIQIRLANASSGGYKFSNHRVDIIFRHAVAVDPVEVVRHCSRSQRFASPILDSSDVLLAAGIGELQYHLAVVDSMHLLSELSPKWNFVIAINERVVG